MINNDDFNFSVDVCRLSWSQISWLIYLVIIIIFNHLIFASRLEHTVLYRWDFKISNYCSNILQFTEWMPFWCWWCYLCWHLACPSMKSMVCMSMMMIIKSTMTMKKLLRDQIKTWQQGSRDKHFQIRTQEIPTPGATPDNNQQQQLKRQDQGLRFLSKNWKLFSFILKFSKTAAVSSSNCQPTSWTLQIWICCDWWVWTGLQPARNEWWWCSDWYKHYFIFLNISH